MKAFVCSKTQNTNEVAKAMGWNRRTIMRKENALTKKKKKKRDSVAHKTRISNILYLFRPHNISCCSVNFATYQKIIPGASLYNIILQKQNIRRTEGRRHKKKK